MNNKGSAYIGRVMAGIPAKQAATRSRYADWAAIMRRENDPKNPLPLICAALFIILMTISLEIQG